MSVEHNVQVPLNSMWQFLTKENFEDQLGRKISEAVWNEFLNRCHDDWSTQAADLAHDMLSEEIDDIIFDLTEEDNGTF